MPAPVNVTSNLAELARVTPYRPAVFFPQSRDSSGRTAWTQYTFQQLHQQTDAIAWGLKYAGITRGMRTVLMVPPSLDFFALTFALFRMGAVPVLIDPGMGVRNLGKCLGEARPEAFIGIPKAHLARSLLRWGRKSLRITITTGKRGGTFRLDSLRTFGLRKESYPAAETQAEEIAAILFTSGSTGVAKGVVYTHGIFVQQVEMLRKAFAIQPGEIDLATFPLFALFGPALGMTAVVPEMDPTRPAEVDPKKIIEAIESFGVTNLFGSPALINRVGRFGAEHGIKLPSLKRVTSAGAPVPAKVIDTFTKLLSPGVQVFTPYGATESLPVAVIGSDEVLKETRFETERGGGVCVGLPALGMEVRIIPIREEAILNWNDALTVPQGEIGEIVVRGPVVTASYWNRDEATRLAKIPDGGSFWHRMGDLGYLDAQGRLWFCGRKSHRVETAEGTLFTIPCEGIFNTHPEVYRTALVGVQQGRTKIPVLCVEMETGSRKPFFEVEAELRQIGQKFPQTREIRTFLRHPGFPVDIRHNAKIFREKLADWAEKQLRK